MYSAFDTGCFSLWAAGDLRNWRIGFWRKFNIYLLIFWWGNFYKLIFIIFWGTFLGTVKFVFSSLGIFQSGISIKFIYWTFWGYFRSKIFTNIFCLNFASFFTFIFLQLGGWNFGLQFHILGPRILDWNFLLLNFNHCSNFFLLLFFVNIWGRLSGDIFFG